MVLISAELYVGYYNNTIINRINGRREATVDRRGADSF